MKKLIGLLIFLGLFSISKAQDIVAHNSGKTMYASPISKVDSIKFDETYSKFNINGSSSSLNIQKAVIDSLTFSESTVNLDKIYIIYNGTDNATIINPYASQGINISANGGNVTVAATSGISNLEYNLLGTSSSGYLSMSSDTPANFVLNNLNLTNASGPAIIITGGQTNTFTLQSGTSSSLTDGTSNSKNGALQSSGAITFNGMGNLTVTGVKKHGIVSSSSIEIQNGNITINSAASDGLHSEGYTQNGGELIVTSSTGDGIDAGDGNINITEGTTKITSTSADVKAIKTGAGNIIISGGNITYSVAGNQSKGISTNGSITFNGGNITADISGDVVLEASGSGYDPSYCTAIKADGNITVNGGTFNITIEPTSDGGKGFSSDSEINITDGNLSLNTSGTGASYTNADGLADSYSSSCFSSDTNINVSGSTISLALSGADAKGLSADNNVNISNGSITANHTGVQGKIVKADGNITVSGGTLNFILSGAAVLETSGSGYDPSYSTGLKADGQIDITAGNITINTLSGATGAKGISADSDININGGTFNITTAGNGATYTNASGTTDSYTAACIKSDTNINILAGELTLSSSGTGGKGVSADGTLVLGNLGADNSALTLNVTTSGNRFLVSGSGNNADYANPKAVKSEGNLTLNSGTFTINCTQTADGGEGLESKATLTINGGKTEISTWDDAINATTAIVINGGETYSYAKNNDGIDSNGTLTINGGFTVSNGARTPEEGFDCDNNTFKITGGTIVGTGGATSNPSSVSTQKSLKVTTTAGNNVYITNSSGTQILMYKVPSYYGTGNSNSVTLLFTSPSFVNGTYTIKRGGTITGGTESHGYVTGGTYTGGTSTNFTVSSYLTTVN